MLDHLLIQDVLDEALSMGADFAELYVEQTDSQTITMVGGKVDKANRGEDYGVGIRLFQGTNCVYGYTNDSTRENLLKTAREIAQALVGQQIIKPLNLVRQEIVNQHLIKLNLEDVPASRRIEKCGKRVNGLKTMMLLFLKARLIYLRKTKCFDC